MKKFTILLIIFLATASSFAFEFTNKLDAYSKNLLNKILAKQPSETTLTAKSYGYPFEINNNEVYINCLVELNSNGTNSIENYEIVTRAGNIFAIKVPLSKIGELQQNNFVSKISFGKKYRILLDSARRSVRADLVHQGINLPRSYTGKGVLIGIFDTGIDLLHPDFKNENGTRVLYLWDMSETITPKPPQGFDWGREYTKQEIDDNLQNVLQKDVEGHGTHIAGIAAGNGKGKPSYIGIAPDATLIIVNGKREGNSQSFSDADIIAACNYIFYKADELGKPCVINLSLGSIIGSHDAEDLLGKALSNLVAQKKGRAIVASAGNEGDLPIHTGGDLKKDNRYEILLYPYNLCDYEPELCPDIPNYFLFGADIWSNAEVIDSIYVGIYNLENFAVVDEKGFSAKDIIDKAQIFDSTNQLVGLVSLSNSTYGNTENILVFISNEGQEDLTLADYLWSIVLVTKKDGRFDAWAALPIGSQYPAQSRFQRFPADNLMTINSPAVGEKIISVGAYVSKNKFTNILGEYTDWSQFYSIGELASFSSRGPTRDGRIAPLVTAPGMVVFSSLSSTSIPEDLDSTLIDPSGIYIGYSGTSMSAPIVTGAIALLFEQLPNLAIDEIFELIKLSARKDEHTGAIPNNDFGWGKLDVLSLLQIVTDVKENMDNSEIFVYPNPATDFLLIVAKENIQQVEIYNALGGKIFQTDKTMFPVDILAPGIYFLKIKTHNKEHRIKFIKR